jgi:capsular polysaccharide transport system permease protein
MYVSETRFSLRSQEGSGSTELLAFLGQSTGGTGTDAHVIEEYIESSELLTLLNKQLNLQAHYQNSQADFFSRLQQNPSQEEFTKYFQRQVTIRFNQTSGILKLQVRAFTPQAAQNICQAILSRSEDLINRLRERAIEDSLALSRAEIERAEQRLTNARKKLHQFRMTHNLLDPSAEAGKVEGLVAELEGAAVKVRAELAEAQSYMRKESAKVVGLRARLDALEEQIIKEKLRLAGRGKDTINSLASEYEQLTIEHEFTQKELVVAMQSLEAARIRAESKSRYLVAFIQPTLPDEPLWPRRGYSIGVSFAGILLIFGMGSLMVAAIREHAGF